MERRLSLTQPKRGRYARISLIGGLVASPTKGGMRISFYKGNCLKMSKKEIRCGGRGYGKTVAYISSALKDSPWIRGEVVADRLKWLDEMYNPYFFRNFMVKKKMTKKEAHEYLKNSKIYVDGKSAQILKKLLEAGFEKSSGIVVFSDMPFLYVGSYNVRGGYDMLSFADDQSKELKADDILSIEIEENPEDKIVELAKPLMEYLQEQDFTDSIRVTAEGIYRDPYPSILYEI